MINNRKLHHTKAFRVRTGDGPPRPGEGSEGELTIRTTKSGLKLFVKFKNAWYAFGGEVNLGIPGGTNTEEVLSQSDLRPLGSRNKETFVDGKTNNLEMAGNIKLPKNKFINRDGVKNKGLYFGRDDVAKPGQAYFDDDVFMQLGYKLYLSDGNLAAEADGAVNASWIVAPLDEVVQHVVDGNIYLELDKANTRVRLKQKALIGANGYITIDDNEIDVSSGDLTVDVAGDMIADVAGGQFTVKSTNVGDPDIVVESNSDDGLAGTLTFKKEGRTGAADDFVGMILFNGEDAGNNLQNYAYIHGRVDVPIEGQEGGRLELGVASHDGGDEIGLKLTGGSVDAEVDVTIGNGTASMTTIAGDLDIDGDTITTAGNLTLDVNGGITLDANNGNFVTKNAGTEFSVANSAYAGMIIGCTHVFGSGTLGQFVQISTTWANLVWDTDKYALVTFVVPPSNKVKISVHLPRVDANSYEVRLGLATDSSATTLNTKYENTLDDANRPDLFNINYSWVVAGSDHSWSAGETKTLYIMSYCSNNVRFRSGGTNTAYYGGVIVEATALPGTIGDGSEP